MKRKGRPKNYHTENPGEEKIKSETKQYTLQIPFSDVSSNTYQGISWS